MCYTKYKKVSGVETDFVWDGDEIGAEYDENGNVTNVLFRGNNLVRDSKGNNYVYDSHGSVTSILNNNGSKSKEYEYDAFGNIENETNASLLITLGSTVVNIQTKKVDLFILEIDTMIVK